MSKNYEWFSIEGVSSAKHTAETKRIQAELETLLLEEPLSFNQFGKVAIVNLAKSKGFVINENDDTPHETAFEYMLNYHDGLASKSGIIRHAIKEHAKSYNL